MRVLVAVLAAFLALPVSTRAHVEFSHEVVRDVEYQTPPHMRVAGGDVVVLSNTEFGYTLTAITPQLDGVVSGVSILRQRSYPAFVITVSQGTITGRGNSIVLLSRRL